MPSRRAATSRRCRAKAASRARRPTAPRRRATCVEAPLRRSRGPEASRHLHRADRAVDDVQIAGEPGDGDEGDQDLDQPREIAAAMIASPPAKVRSHARSAVSTASHRRRPAPPPAVRRDQVQPAPAPTRHTVTPSRRAPPASLRPRRDTPREPSGWSPRSASPTPAACSSAQQTPSFGKRDAHAVEREDGILLLEIGGGLLHDVELLFIGTVDAQLRGRVRLGKSASRRDSGPPSRAW